MNILPQNLSWVRSLLDCHFVMVNAKVGANDLGSNLLELRDDLIALFLRIKNHDGLPALQDVQAFSLKQVSGFFFQFCIDLIQFLLYQVEFVVEILRFIENTDFFDQHTFLL